MATAKRPGGLYYTAQGIAVDANGEAVKGAPKKTPDTDPSKQPGAPGALTSEERIGVAIAQAITNPAGVIAKQQAAEAAAAKGAAMESTENTGDEGDESELPTVADLPDHLAGLKTADEVRALQKSDERTTAQKHYEARLAELEGGGQ